MLFSHSNKPDLKIVGANEIAVLYPTDGLIVSVWTNVHGCVQIDIHDEGESGEHFVVMAVPDPSDDSDEG